MRCRGIGGIVLDLLAQSLDVGVQRARVGELESPPQRVEADLAGDDLAEPRGEEREQVELLAAELDLVPASGDGASNEVDAQVAERDDLVVGVGDVGRRSTARMRAMSSRSRKGLVT